MSASSSVKRARDWAALVGQHCSVDNVGEPPFEDPDGFHSAVPVVFASVEQFTSWRVTPCLTQSDPV